jgi:hypothetical protein
MLFDGAVAATVADAAASNNDHATADSAAKNTSTDDSSQHPSAATPPAATSDNRHEVVFVDGQVGDKQQIIDGLKPGTEVVVLDSNKDGLQQIADYLKDRSDIDAIHIISHGDTGKVQLGNGWVDNASLASHGEALAAIGKALSSDGDILLYGCTVGANGEGQDFIQALAAKTGADVAASDDATGAASRGGDWVLERQVGAVETGALAFDSYTGLLANGTVTFNANDNANWADGIAEDGNGGSSNIPGITLQISNVSDVNGTNLGLPLVYGDAQNGDDFFAVTTYDASVQSAGWKGMQVRSADGSEFKMTGFNYWNYGEISDTIVTVKGYRDGVEVASTTFTATMTGFFVQKSAIFDATFGSVDQVILYTNSDSWHGLNNIQIADPVMPNASPVATTSGGTTAFTEGNNVTSTPVVVDSGITLTDADNSTLASGTVSITGNFQSGEDTLAFTNNPATMGNISASYNSATGILSLSSSGATATLAQWQAALRSVTYTDSSNTPNTGGRTISFVVNDGNSNSTAGNKIVSVAAVNDVPVATTSGGQTAFTEGNNATSSPVVVDSGFTVTDLDNSTLASANVSITGNFQLGQDVLAFTNNPATMGNITGVYDSSTGALAMSSAGATATLAQWQAALRSITYTNSSETPTAGPRIIAFRVNDGTNINTSSKQLTVTAVNDTPVATASGGTTAFTEGDNVTSTPVAIDSGITLSDLDNSTLASATVAITGNFQSGEDELGFTNNPATMGNISASYNAATGVMTLTSAGATATLAQWQAALRSVTYTDTAQTANSATRIISFTTNDGGQNSNTATKTVTVTAVDSSPIATTSGGSSAFTEGNNVVSTPVTVDSAITLSDSDSSTLASATVAITGNLQSSQDVLAFTNNPATMGNISANYNSATGVLSLSSAGATATVAQWQAALRSVTYSNSSEQPNTGNRTVSFSVSDGNSSSNLATKVVSVAAVNDAPVNSMPGAQALSQNGTLTFNTGNGNLISISDTDAGGGVGRVTLTVTNGLLTLSGISGLSFLVGNGSNDGTTTFEGTLADINNALNGMTFTPTPGYNGTAILQVTSNDLGLSGAGGNQSDTNLLVITVDPINPVITSVTGSNGTYGINDSMFVTLTFNQAVYVDTTGGIPSLLLETGAIDHNATYVAGSGSNTLVFSYTVQAGDVSADLDYASTSALALNGATIQSAGSDNAILTLPTPGTANSLGANSNLVIDGVAATVTSVTAPAGTTYGPGQNLDFIVNLSEAVTVDSTGGTPRLAITLDTGGTVYADYLSGSGTSALVFRLTVSNGQRDSNGISLGNALSLNGATLRDSAGNNSVLSLNSVGSTAGVLVDAVAPDVSGIVLDGASPTNATSVSFTVTFTEDVTGVDTTDFSLTTSGGVSGTVQSVVQINAHTYQVLVDGITGLGTVGLSLNASGTGITDASGNPSAGAFTGPSYTIGIPVIPTPDAPIVSPDPEFRTNPPAPMPPAPSAPLQPIAPVVSPPLTTSPLVLPSLFEQPTIGSGIPTLGNIFINQNALAPSYIAQVFASSDSGGDGSGVGFLGFGGGDGGVFGSSSLSGLFNKESASDVAPIKLFEKTSKGGDASKGLRGAFGAQTLGEQLRHMQHQDQQQVQELAAALGQLSNSATPS